MAIGRNFTAKDLVVREFPIPNERGGGEVRVEKLEETFRDVEVSLRAVRTLAVA